MMNRDSLIHDPYRVEFTNPASGLAILLPLMKMIWNMHIDRGINEYYLV
jgi:hypothetical protein